MEHNMTQGREWPSILIFALPLMASSLLQTLFTFADSVIVGNFVNAEAFGGIGLLNPVTMLLTFCATSLGTGASIVASQFFGAGRKEDVKVTASTGMWLCLGQGLLTILLCELAAAPLIRGFLQTPENMAGYSMTYFRVLSAGLLFVYIYNMSYGTLRAHGDSRGAMLFLLVAAVLNVGLDLIFILVFGMGVFGAALATVIAQAGSAVAATWYLWKNFPEFNFMRRENRSFRREKMSMIYKITLPILAQQSILSIGFIILQRLINSLGEACIEGFAAMQKVESFIHIPSNALNVAMSSFTGQNIGAGRPDRVRRGYRVTALMGMGSCGVIAVILIAFSAPLFGLFNISPEATLRATEQLRILVVCMLFYSVSNITSGLLQGAGDVKIPAMGSFVNLFIRVSLSYILSVTAVGVRCYYYSLPFAWFSAFLLNFLRYRSGKWETKKLV